MKKKKQTITRASLFSFILCIKALLYIFMMVTHVEDFKILQIERVSQIINKVIEVTQHKPQPSVLSTL